jgi:tRNA A-37 threonylcarbamoyl transferase component Bud32
MSPPRTDAATLRSAGREPSLPAVLTLGDGRELHLLRALRVLPERRITAEARLAGEPVLAKLFVSDAAVRHAARERDGLDALHAAGIATPECVAQAALPGGGAMIATHFLANAQSLSDCWNTAPRPAGNLTAIALLAPALAALACMHAAGLTQSDLHLGNFMVEGGSVLVIDGDAVERHPTPLSPQTTTANLAILLAQLPPDWDAHLAALVAPYVAAGGAAPDAQVLQREIDAVRERRLADILAKSVRDCSLFAVTRSATRFTSVVRDETTGLATLLDNPDRAMHAGTLLKDGNTSTVARVDHGTRTLVVKRYNLKNPAHALSRAWRPSRAWHAWRAAHRLAFLDIATPRPLALVEERLGPLRRRAWLLTEYCAGPNLLDLLDPHATPPDDIATALLDTLLKLHAARIHHGDLKATNLLWHDGRVFLIDLDATTAHRSATRFQQAWARDRARLLRNWPTDSKLGEWLDASLP